VEVSGIRLLLTLTSASVEEPEPQGAKIFGWSRNHDKAWALSPNYMNKIFIGKSINLPTCIGFLNLRKLCPLLLAVLGAGAENLRKHCHRVIFKLFTQCLMSRQHDAGECFKGVEKFTVRC
jgi:hypothetical protein